MSLLIRPTDPRPNKNDEFLSEQVEYIIAENVDMAVHQAAVNAFLTGLRDDPNHIVIFRDIRFVLEKLTGGAKMNGVTEIWYFLIGDNTLPFLP